VRHVDHIFHHCCFRVHRRLYDVHWLWKLRNAGWRWCQSMSKLWPILIDAPVCCASLCISAAFPPVSPASRVHFNSPSPKKCVVGQTRAWDENRNHSNSTTSNDMTRAEVQACSQAYLQLMCAVGLSRVGWTILHPIKGADTQSSRKTGSKPSSLHFVTLSALAPQRLNRSVCYSHHTYTCVEAFIW
jgi:hypothetical protein